MIKRLIVIILLLILVVSVVIYMSKGSTAKLEETVTLVKQENSFVLHIRVEPTEDGFQILRSLEYNGEEKVTIDHRTPLISTSMRSKNHDFTGSHVNKTMGPGAIYHPHKPETFMTPKKGVYVLYVQCQFFIKGDPVNIYAEKEITFN